MKTNWKITSNLFEQIFKSNCIIDVKRARSNCIRFVMHKRFMTQRHYVFSSISEKNQISKWFWSSICTRGTKVLLKERIICLIQTIEFNRNWIYSIDEEKDKNAAQNTHTTQWSLFSLLFTHKNIINFEWFCRLIFLKIQTKFDRKERVNNQSLDRWLVRWTEKRSGVHTYMNMFNSCKPSYSLKLRFVMILEALLFLNTFNENKID